MPARQDSRAFSDTSYVGGCSSCALPTFCSKGSGMRVYWKWVIKSVPILGLTLLMLATTVTPRQAPSNVEAWFNYFGIAMGRDEVHRCMDFLDCVCGGGSLESSVICAIEYCEGQIVRGDSRRGT